VVDWGWRSGDDDGVSEGGEPLNSIQVIVMQGSTQRMSIPRSMGTMDQAQHFTNVDLSNIMFIPRSKRRSDSAGKQQEYRLQDCDQ
jgi:hypothetical protein